MSVRAVVFDFDGVLANSEPLHFRGFRDVLAGEGVVLTERDYYARYLGYDDAGAFRAVAAEHRLVWDDGAIAALVERKAARLEALEQGASVLFPGAADAVRRLAAAWPLAIASGALRAEILRVLHREDLAGCFVTVVAAEDAAAGKPAPDPYRRAVEALAESTRSLSPAECVAVEDSVWGLESARTAGLRTVAVSHTYPAEQLAIADAIVPHLDALTIAFLRSVTSGREKGSYPFSGQHG